MRVLITGGAGFIGSHLADAFVTGGAAVAVADDFSAGRPGRVAEQAVTHKVDIADAAALAEAVGQARPELICHLAAQIDVRVSVREPARDAGTNVLGTVNVLEAARSVGARVLFASSGGAIYGREAPLPTPEEEPALPESPYGVAKQCAECYLGLYNRLHHTEHATLRLANVYGPRQDPSGEAGVIAVFCRAVLAGEPPTVYGDGAQTRDYVYVGDVVRAFLAAAGQPGGGTWNIGTGREVSVLDLARVIASTTGREVPLTFAPPRAGEVRRSVLATGRAARELGWTAQTTLPDGIAAVCRWIEAGAPERAPSQVPG
jgi:UDP-glucose 4-epimerase